MQLVSERSNFETAHRVFFRGRDGEEGGGTVTVTIQAEGITTEQMTAELEHLAMETMARIKKIVAAQEAPQQFLEKNEDKALNLWLQYNKEYQQAAGDTASGC